MSTSLSRQDLSEIRCSQVEQVLLFLIKIREFYGSQASCIKRQVKFTRMSRIKQAAPADFRYYI